MLNIKLCVQKDSVSTNSRGAHSPTVSHGSLSSRVRSMLVVVLPSPLVPSEAKVKTVFVSCECA